ncbi:MAG: YitT family protein [[Clostridium] spiroforme]|uniref:YitT family protein n=1 Tax=Thomasclavelia spiroformis TaxID=29348 RepID=A0A943EKC9_9FIRM|nr:YitT family protein [Thomasclavelia spiroformis]MBS5588139.1 YitT family protein [Thomasclavelia spiroformis]
MKKSVYETIIIVIGNLILAFGLCAFVTPVGLISGGASGIGIAVKSITGINISYTVYVINFIMFVIGFIFLGKKFAYGTLLSTFLYPTFIALFERIPQLTNITNDILLSALYGGLCIGLGLGLVLRVGASTGGMDIPPLLVNKKTGISVAWLINIFDCGILLLQVIFCPIAIEAVLYGITVVIITTIVVDKVIILGETKIQVLVISPKWQEIRRIIFDDINRGCTLLNVTTGYYQDKQLAVMAVVSKRELHLLNDMILEIDPTAFIISNETHSVKGRGFTLPSVELQKNRDH